MDKLILVINTGNSSTKVGVFRGREPHFVESIRHSDQELVDFTDIHSQKDFREKMIRSFLKTRAFDEKNLAAIAARGGLLKPLDSGTYEIDQAMITDLIKGRRGTHASHLSAQIAFSISRKHGIKSYIVDPISVDELEPIARYTGHRCFERIMLSHALNMKAIARRHARERGQEYEYLNLIVVHLGSGISVSVHRRGRMVDGINSSEEGPFSPDRSGGLPVLQVVQFALDKKMPFTDFRKMIFGNGGFQSYLNTRDFYVVMDRVNNGDSDARDAVQAMAYQVAKEVGALSTVVEGKVDAILLTGGMAREEYLVQIISDRVQFIAPLHIYPGEDEMQALAEGVIRVLNGEEEARKYGNI